MGSDQPFRRQPFRSKNRKKRPEFREKSPKTESVLSDVPKSGSAEVRRPVYICAASAASQRHASWPFSCGGASPPHSLLGGGCGRLLWRTRYWRWPQRKPAPASLDWVQRTAAPPRFHRCHHRCDRRSHLSADSPRSPRGARAGRRLRWGTAGVLVAVGSPQRALATPREVIRRFGYLCRVSAEVGGSGAIGGRVSGRAKERLGELGWGAM